MKRHLFHSLSFTWQIETSNPTNLGLNKNSRITEVVILEKGKKSVIRNFGIV